MTDPGWSIWFAWRPVWCADVRRFVWLSIVWRYRSQRSIPGFTMHFVVNESGQTPQEAATDD
jgi:hypothetical protein